ncbi:MAG: hypothetical protein HZB61_09555 [Nitrospirae bacterium]|nr:hypothetical protein [Nitrospirota bacterium]
MEPKIIKTEINYKQTLAEVERLIALDPEPGTPEADRLDLFSLLVENYEKEHFLFNLPSPIDAINFRIEEQGLKQKDLIPYIGSKSKVSEVLSGKRPLTIQMIRELHKGLDIPAEVLLQDIHKPKTNKSFEKDWNKFPVKEMVKRGWITTKYRDLDAHAEELMKQFFAPLGGEIPSVAICRRTIHKRAKQETDMNALLVWTARVMIRAHEECCPSEFFPGTVTKDFLREVARLSCFDKGPLLAKEFLEKHGIALIIEPHLPKTLLDGGSMLTDAGGPVIGLTIRHDRIDNFWYTLVHELLHVAKHLKNAEEIFIDDLYSESGEDPKEKEADRLTKETFIPRSIWIRSDAYLKRSPGAIIQLAKELRIHPAIVAGRIRWDTGNYTLFNQLIGQGEVKKLFI